MPDPAFATLTCELSSGDQACETTNMGDPALDCWQSFPAGGTLVAQTFIVSDHNGQEVVAWGTADVAGTLEEFCCAVQDDQATIEQVTLHLNDGGSKGAFHFEDGAAQFNLAPWGQVGMFSLGGTIVGGGGGDTILGSDCADVEYFEALAGWGGDDTIRGRAGDDFITGFDGEDDLGGGDGIDTIFGDNDNDQITGGDDGDIIWGGDHDDTIHGGGGDDIIDGGDGLDTIVGASGSDDITGGARADTILGGPNDDVINGGDGDDTLKGGSGNDEIRGGPGEDRLLGGADNDNLCDEGDSDLFDGGTGNDNLYYDDTVSPFGSPNTSSIASATSSCTFYTFPFNFWAGNDCDYSLGGQPPAGTCP